MKQAFKKYSYLYLICCIILLLPFVMSGKTLVHQADAAEQFYPTFLYTGRWLRDCLAGRFHLYDLSIGFGEDIIGTLNYYGFGDPISLLAILADTGNGAILYSICHLCRIYLAGLTMIFYICQRRSLLTGNSAERNVKDCNGNGNGEAWSLAIAGVFYSFSMYVLWQGLWFPSFLTCAYLFPLLAAYLEKFCREKEHVFRNMAVLAFLITLQACNGFYFLYMSGLSLFFYWIILVADRKNLRETGKGLGRLILSGLLGLMLAGPILFPAVEAYLGSSRSGRESLRLQLLPYLTDLIQGVTTSTLPTADPGRTGLGMSVLGIAAILYPVISPVTKRREKFYLFFLTLAYLCPAFWQLMNGLSYPVDRWTYVIYFWCSLLVFDLLHAGTDKEDRSSEKGAGRAQIFLLLVGLWCLVSLILHYFEYGGLIRLAGAGLGLVAFLAAWRLAGSAEEKGLGRTALSGRLLMPVAFWQLVIGLIFLTYPYQIAGQQIYQLYESREELSSENLAQMPNVGLVTGVRQPSEYFSMLNGHIFDFYRDFMISSGIQGATHHLAGLDDRETLEQTLKLQGENVISWQGYTKSMTEEEFLNLTPVERQAVSAESVVLAGLEDDETRENKDLPETDIEGTVDEGSGLVTDLSFELVPDDNVTIQQDESGQISVEAAAGSELVIKVTSWPSDIGDGRNELYLYLGHALPDAAYRVIYVDGKRLVIDSDQSQYYDGQENYLVRLPEAEQSGSVRICFETDTRLQLDDISLQSLVVRGRNADASSMVEGTALLDGDRFDIAVAAEQKGWILINVPYHRNWSARVDGQPARILQADIGFMALEVAPGSHEIEFIYRPIPFYIGMATLIVAVVILVVLLVLDRRDAMPGLMPSTKLKERV